MCDLKGSNSCGICKVTGKDICNHSLITKKEAEEILNLVYLPTENKELFIKNGLNILEKNLYIYD